VRRIDATDVAYAGIVLALAVLTAALYAVVLVTS